MAQARGHEDPRRLPGAGLLAVFGAQPEVRRREHEADLALRRRFGPRVPAGEQQAAGNQAEVAAAEAHDVTAVINNL